MRFRHHNKVLSTFTLPQPLNRPPVQPFMCMARKQSTTVQLRPDQLAFLDEQSVSNSQIMRQALDDYIDDRGDV